MGFRLPLPPKSRPPSGRCADFHFLLAQHPFDRVYDVALAAAVRSDNSRDRSVKDEFRSVGKLLKPSSTIFSSRIVYPKKSQGQKGHLSFGCSSETACHSIIGLLSLIS